MSRSPSAQTDSHMEDGDSTPTSRTLTGKYRRNGKLQSCEPCRKSKLKCDHVVPVCGRCVKRRCADKCVYHPHPLTRRQTTTIPTPSTSVSYDNGSPQFFNQTIESPHSLCLDSTGSESRALHSTKPTVQGQRAASAPPLDVVQRESAVRPNPGFVGVTSYTSIFSEGLGGLDASADLDTPYNQEMTVSNERIIRGCQILSFLKDKSVVNRLVSHWFERCEDSGAVCPEFIVKEWLFRLMSQHGETLTSQNPDKLRRLSQMLWRNTQTPLSYDRNTAPMEYARLGTGINIRWEVIGLIAVHMGISVENDPSDLYLVEHNINPHKLSKRMCEIAQTCIEFCRDCEVLDDMLMWLLLETQGLVSVTTGDRSFATYRASGELNDGVIAMGLHQGVKPTDNIPFFLSELRKRLFRVVYTMEISLAAFLGRPPRLSYRYCAMDPPLDLTDSQLALQGPELAAALADLDDQGYNKSKQWRRVTWLRAYSPMAARREEILDLALGTYSREEILQRAEVIEAKTQAYWNSLPRFVSRVTDEAMDFRKMKPDECLVVSAMRQGLRSNQLLLQRVLIRQTGATPEKLIQAAHAIFSDVLQITSRHDIAAMFRMTFTGIIVSHGLRSGAIIAVELYKQEQLSAYPEKPLLPRSQTIQELSVLASRLGAIDPADGAYGMCDQGRKIITRILDKILTPKPGTQLQTNYRHPLSQQGFNYSTGNVPVELPIQQTIQDNSLGLLEPSADLGTLMEGPVCWGDEDFTQWLETMDWDRPNVWSGF